MSFTYVEVVWDDAHALCDGWVGIDEFNNDPVVTVSLGVLLPEAKKGHVTVAQSHNSQDQFDCVLFIPVGMVKSVRVLGDGEQLAV